MGVVDAPGDPAFSGPPRALLCARCGAPIARTEARIAVAGQHEHERTNPGGYTFRFGCFASAEGCRSDGVPSKQATWFPGYWWQIQVCARCGELLGWLFFDGERQFVGLILDRLVEEPSPSA